MNKNAIFLAFTLLIGGCTPAPYVKEDEPPMKFNDAMNELMDGLNTLAMKANSNPDKEKLGIVPSKITAVFDVSTAKDKNGTVSLNLTPVSVISGMSGSLKSDDSLKRSNQIKIEFDNVNLLKYNARLEASKNGKGNEQLSKINYGGPIIKYAPQN